MKDDLITNQCYAASEYFYHLFGGKKNGWKPMQMVVWISCNSDYVSHWFLRHTSGIIFDPTAAQFDYRLPYSRAIGRGFLTKRMSRKGREWGRRFNKVNA